MSRDSQRTTERRRARVLLFTSFPPPLTGQNVMSERVAGWVAEVAEAYRVDTADPGALTAAGGGLRHLGRMVGRWRALRQALRRRPDVLYLVLSSSRVGRLRDLVTLALARRRVRRVVGHVQVGDFVASLARPGWRRLSRRLLRQVDAVLVLSPRLVPAIEPFARPGAVRVVPNTAPGMVASTDELARRRAARAGASTLRVAFVANMLEGKGQEALVDGVAHYQAEHPDRPAEVDLVGAWRSPDARAAFERRLARLGLAESVRIHGAVADREWLRRLYLASDVVALPSRYRHEALPVCLVEALATGTPVIGSDHAALPDLVTPRTGMLLADERPATIAEALRDMTDPVRWAEWSRGARETYERGFSEPEVRRAVLAAMGLELP